MARHKRLIEQTPLILPVVNVEPRAQPPAVGQGILVFSAAPTHHADIGTGLGLRTPAKREAANIDELRIRGRVDIGIRRQGKAEIPAPAAPGPHEVQKSRDFGNYGDRWTADQGPLEMVTGQVVVVLQIKSQGQFQTDTHQSRPVDQDRPEGPDGLVQEREPLLILDPGFLGSPAGGQPEEKQHVRLVRMVRPQRPQDVQGLGKAVALDQRPREVDARVGGQVGLAGRSIQLETGRRAGRGLRRNGDTGRSLRPSS